MFSSIAASIPGISFRSASVSGSLSETGSELTILESDNIWGPFYLLHYEWMWDSRECCPYNPRIPLKWFDQNTLEGYLLHSGSWGYMGEDGVWLNPPEYYRPHFKKFKIGHRDSRKNGKFPDWKEYKHF